MQTTWEPLKNFFHLYAQPIVNYVQKEHLKMDVMEYLARNPTEIVRIGAPSCREEEDWEEHTHRLDLG